MAQVTRPKLINIFNHCFKGTFYIPSEEDEIESSKRKIWLDIAIGIGRGISRALELSWGKIKTINYIRKLKIYYVRSVFYYIFIFYILCVIKSR